MLGDGLELGRPMRVDRPEGFEVTADPLHEHVARGALRHFYGVVHTDKTNSFFRKRIEFLQVLVDRMSASAV